MSTADTPDPMLRIAVSIALTELVSSRDYDRDWHDYIDEAIDQWFRKSILPASLAGLLPADLVAQVHVVDDGKPLPPKRTQVVRAGTARTGVDLLPVCFECGITLRANLEYVEILGRSRPFCNECAARAREFFGIEEPER